MLVRINTVSPDLDRKIRQVARPRTIYEAGAKTVQREIVKHLRKLQARGNHMGWPSQGFFAGAKTSVEKNVGISKISDTGAVITIADPRFVHRIEGGRVTPKRRKYLIIPLNAAAYALAGRGSVRESAPFLQLVGKRKLYLGVVKGDRIDLWFALVKSVTHHPHPEEAPPVEEIKRVANQSMTRAADLLLGATR